MDSDNVSGVSVTLADNDPAGVPAANPTLANITPMTGGVAIFFVPAVGTASGTQMEAATSYDVRFSTAPDFSVNPVVYNFKASGGSAPVWLLHNGMAGLSGSPFASGQTLYFEARARNAAGHAASWSIYGGGTPAGITPNTAPRNGPRAMTSGTSSTASGSVIIPSSVTPTGPLFVGFYDPSNGAVYVTEIAAPSTGTDSPNPYTVTVPSGGGNWVNFAILDQNNDGMIDAGDVNNVIGGGNSVVAVTPPMTGVDLTLPAANIGAAVRTLYTQDQESSSATFTMYQLDFDLRQGNKLPVKVTLAGESNVDLVAPVDFSNYCPGCGDVHFQSMQNPPITFPSTIAAGDTYTFNVTYSDGTSESDVTAAVTGFNGGSSAIDWNVLANLSWPDVLHSPGTTPDFIWTYPSGCPSCIYQFLVIDNNGNTVWQIPGPNSRSSGFTYDQIPAQQFGELHWGQDPTDPSNTPNPASLTPGQTYRWQVSVIDSHGNQATNVISFVP